MKSTADERNITANMFAKLGSGFSLCQLNSVSRKLNKSAFTVSFLPMPCHCSEVYTVTNRKYSYYKSKTEESPDKYTKFEKSFKEWKFVERLLPPTHVPPAPTDCNVSYPSGWCPPNPPKDCSYIVRRTKNHVVPVYLKIEDRGQIRHTYICKVEGNIWQLEKDIGRYLQNLDPREPVILRTNEISRHVIIKGDHLESVKQWVVDQGF